MKLGKNNKTKEFFLGMGIVLLLHLVVFGTLYIVTNSIGSFDAGMTVLIIFLFIGISQLLYIAPLLILLFVLRYRMIAYGVITAAGITMLLNGACFGIFTLSELPFYFK